MTFYNPIVPPFMPSFFSNKYYNKKSLPQEIKMKIIMIHSQSLILI